jgi:DNA-binding CsgD family transcriptional regulator/tetratricopeptide (TPR) repeat protein
VTTTLISPGLVGRAAEFKQLRDAFAAATEGRPTTVLLGGEAGVGKTRLVTEFAAEAAEGGARVVAGQCVELGEDGLPFAPIAGALRDLADQLGVEELLELAGPGRDVLPSLLPELGAGATAVAEGRGRLFEVVTVLLEQVSADRPLLLVVEDLHWADGSTRHLLQFVVRALGSARVALVMTYRSDDVHRRHPLRPFLAELDRVRGVHRVDLPRLSEDEVGEQLAGILGQAPAPRVVAKVFRRSEGVPFFVEELARAGVEESSPPLPDSLRDLLLVRVEQLSDPALDVLRSLATGGVRVEDALLSAVTELAEPSLEAALREAVSSNIIRVDGNAYEFRHALLREVLHDDLLPGAHARMHIRYAETLEQHPELVTTGLAAVEIAHHWYAAHEQERAFAAYLRAAEQTRRAYAHGETLRMLERALELWHRMPEPEAVADIDRAGVLRRAARAAEDAGEQERALALVKAALAEPAVRADVLRRANLVDLKAKLLDNLGQPAALAVLNEALDLVPVSPPSAARARLLSQLATRHMLADRHAAAIEVAEEAIVAARAAGATDAEARAHNVLAPSLIHSGQVEKGLAVYDREQEIAVEDPRLLVVYHINYSDSLNLLGRYADAARVARNGIERATDLGLARSLGAMLAGNTAEPLLALGQWDEAEQLITRTLELDPPDIHTFHLMRLQAWLLLWRGDIAGAVTVLDELSVLQTGRVSNSQYTMPITQTAAEVALAQGDPAAAWQHVSGALDLPASPGYRLPLLAAGAAALGAMLRSDLPVPDVDVSRLRSAVESIGDWGPAAVWGAVIDAELAGDDPAAWQAAWSVVGAADGPAHLVGYTRYRHGSALAAAGERAEAAEVLRDAAVAANRLGAGLVRGWISDLARRTGIRLLDQVNGPTMASLTPRELEVLRLVAAGRSNREIGDELFISAKTASVHVSNILAKLGASNRVQAAAIAHRDGLLDHVA